LVKSLDRPSVQPQVEEINQYNKKRRITTGYKLQPMKMSLYDTADSMVMQMWAEYSKWYFGDFSQNETAWSYDATTAEFQDSGAGFGFTPRQSNGTPDGKDSSADLESGFFFSMIEVYQVFGGEFTQFDLINPKIATFDPDDMDYSQSEPATISMSLEFEAILYRNDGRPAPISDNSTLSAVFDAEFNGDTFDVVGGGSRSVRSTTSPQNTRFSVDDIRHVVSAEANGLKNNSGNTRGGGSLGQFGNFDFGSLSSAVRTGRSLAGDVSYLASGNNVLSSLLNLPVGGSSAAVSDIESKLGLPQRAPAAVLGSTLDAAEGTLLGRGSSGGLSHAADYIRANLVGGVSASAVMSDNSARDQITEGDGLALNSQSYGVINAQRPAYSQIGFNESYSTDYSPNSLNPTDKISAYSAVLTRT